MSYTREAFDKKHMEMFGSAATDKDWEDFVYSPGETQVLFMGEAFDDLPWITAILVILLSVFFFFMWSVQK